MTLRSKGGFTLIELLVVIAIIGILSAIVLTAVGSVRNNAKVANIQATLRNAQTAGEIYYNSNNFTYANICTDPQIEEMMDSMRNQGALVRCFVHSSDQDLQRKDWAISVYLDENNMFSVNPQGIVSFSVEDTNNGETDNWNDAMDACSVLGKRLASISQLKALELAWFSNYDRPVSGFSDAPGYWSVTESSDSRAWSISFGNGSIGANTKGGLRYVRCVS